MLLFFSLCSPEDVSTIGKEAREAVVRISKRQGRGVLDLIRNRIINAERAEGRDGLNCG